MPATLQKTKRSEPLTTRAKVTSKGQVTLPSALRKRMGIVAGDSVLFKTRGKEVVVVPQRRESVFEEFRGIGTKGIGSGRQAILDWVREFRGEL
jgi:AbrB family looped-hinge helix DNA binding protein